MPENKRNQGSVIGYKDMHKSGEFTLSPGAEIEHKFMIQPHDFNKADGFFGNRSHRISNK